MKIILKYAGVDSRIPFRKQTGKIYLTEGYDDVVKLFRKDFSKESRDCKEEDIWWNITNARFYKRMKREWVYDYIED